MPALRLLNSLSAWAKIVMPSVGLLSWISIWSPICVDARRRMKVLKWPFLSRIPVRLSRHGDGAGAEGFRA